MLLLKKTLWVLAAALIIPLTGCGHKHENTIICNADLCGFDKIAPELLTGYRVRGNHNSMLQELKEGAVIVGDHIAGMAADAGIAEYWYPLYLSTAVIAVDRERTDAEIHSWSDLIHAGEAVGISDNVPEIRLLLAAMSFGLEGEKYTLEKSTELLASLYSRNLLKFNDYGAPVLICFDYQVAALNKPDKLNKSYNSGGALEIIIPVEGTLTFERGFISQKPLTISENSGDILLEGGFRLPDGRSREDLYPESYENAVLLEDYVYLTGICSDATFVIKRDVRKIGSYFYSSEDGRNHQLFGLVLIVFIILWTGYTLRRVMQKGIRRAVFITAILLVGWVLLRMFKYQISLGVLNQYCWYGYYFFRLGLPLTGMWLSWAIDRPDDALRPPKWWYACAVLNIILFIAVVTNNFHYQAFIFDPRDPKYNINFTYGPVYYAAIVTIFLQLLIMQVIIMYKNRKSPQKSRFAFPIIFYGLIGVYCVGYILRVPLIWETDSTMVNSLFTVFFAEACIRSGLIPVNTKYRPLFERSPLNMKITDSSGNVIMESMASAYFSREDAASVSEENILIYQGDITSGRVVWQENISSLNRLQCDIMETNERLRAANEILAEEERIKSKLAATEAKAELFSELEAEIHSRTLELFRKVAELSQNGDYKLHIASITLLLCYIKRRCILFSGSVSLRRFPWMKLSYISMS